MTDSDRPGRHSKGSTERLIVAIASGNSITSAAASCGISERTARRRLEEPEVAERLAKLRSATLTTAADALATLALDAACVLGEIMIDPSVTASVRVRAASVLLSRALEAREVAVIDERLANLERTIEAQTTARGRFAA